MSSPSGDDAGLGDSRPAPEASGPVLPAVITDAGDRAGRRFLEFFTANIRNPNTRQAYARAVGPFLAWCDERGLSLERIDPVATASYIELLGKTRAPETVKQHLAAIRALFDYLVTGGVLPFNPAASVRGPKVVVRKGKTRPLTPDQARGLLGLDRRRDGQSGCATAL